MCCFSIILHVHSAVEAMLPGVIHAIEITTQKGWRALWIESDVLLTMKSYDVLWYLGSYVLRHPSRRSINRLASIQVLMIT